MLSHQLGFGTSWKMLTRDKGWIKPLMVIALASWIPVVGQIVVLGYGLEWARLTAWGVDSAPKQRGVDLGKMMITGGLAFLISLIVTAVLGVVGFFCLRGIYSSVISNSGLTAVVTSGFLQGVISAFINGGIDALPFVLLAVLNLAIETFVLAAQLRATLYDGFAAGWRFDRLAQMVARDAGGFVHTCLICAASTVVSAALGLVVTLCGQFILYRGLMFGLFAGSFGFNTQQILMPGHTGIVAVIIIAVAAVFALFAFQVVKVAFKLVSVNAMGQWFQRFDVGRWGVSSAPLPDGVPYGKRARGSSSQQGGASGNEAPDPARAAGEPVASEEDAPSDNGTDAREQDGGHGSGGEPGQGPILLGPISSTGDDSAQMYSSAWDEHDEAEEEGGGDEA